MKSARLLNLRACRPPRPWCADFSLLKGGWFCSVSHTPSQIDVLGRPLAIKPVHKHRSDVSRSKDVGATVSVGKGGRLGFLSDPHGQLPANKGSDHTTYR